MLPSNPGTTARLPQVEHKEQLECDDYIELGEERSDLPRFATKARKPSLPRKHSGKQDLRMPILSTFRVEDQKEKEAHDTQL